MLIILPFFLLYIFIFKSFFFFDIEIHILFELFVFLFSEKKIATLRVFVCCEFQRLDEIWIMLNHCKSNVKRFEFTQLELKDFFFLYLCECLFDTKSNSNISNFACSLFIKTWKAHGKNDDDDDEVKTKKEIVIFICEKQIKREYKKRLNLFLC